MKDARLLPAKIYLRDLIQSINNARFRIDIIALIISFKDIEPLEIALLNAVERGVQVRIALDFFSRTESLHTIFGHFESTRNKHLQIDRSLERLQKAGAEVFWLGTQKQLNPYTARTHCKWSVIDDIVYCGGGVNLYHHGIVSADFMLKWQSADVASHLASRFTTIVSNNNHYVEDSSYVIDSKTTLLHDGGAPRVSLIFDHAVELASHASSIIFVSQYNPSGQLVKFLKKANTRYYFNKPFYGTGKPAGLMMSISQILHRFPNEYRHERYLHAKYIIFTMPDGKRAAITGSHNFSRLGATLGTKEVALMTSDEKIIDQLDAFTKKYVQ